MRRDVKLFSGTVTQAVPAKKFLEESKQRWSAQLDKECGINLPALLAASLFLLLFHNSCIGLGSVCLTARIGHVDREDVDCIVVACGCDVAGLSAELKIVDLGFVSTTAEHKWTSRVLRVNFPDTNQSAFLASRSQEITFTVHGHGGDGALMTHDDCLNASISKCPHLHVAFLCMRDGEHAWTLTIQSDEAILIVARVKTVHKDEIFESVDISLDLKYDDNAAKKSPGQLT